MSKLRKKFSSKDWAKCCASFCSKCVIANEYESKYGKKKGKRKLKEDKLKSED